MPAPRDFFATDPQTLARRLLGCTIVRQLPARSGSAPVRLAATIVETEAYLGPEDAAAHSYRGRRTDRNESMYGPPGTAYIYFTYGMHHCFNTICGDEGEPVGVLIRAAAPVEGLAHMRRRRQKGRRARSRREGPLEPLPDADLCRGPARLCEAMALDRRLDGHDLAAAGRPDATLPQGRLWIEPGEPVPPRRIIACPRIGVAYAGDWAARPLRFCIAGDPHVSVRPPRRGRGASRP